MKPFKDWFRIGFFLATSLFWAMFYERRSSSLLLIAVFATLLALWMIAQKVREP